MNKVLQLAICAAFLFSSNAVISQNNNVGIGTTTPDASAKLEVESTNQGFLPPRMSRGAILSIASPAEGLVAYNTDSKTLNVFNGTDWTDMTGTIVLPQVGDLYGGGILIHFFVNGENGYVPGETHGIICATEDEVPVGTFIPWGCYGTQFADVDAIGYGGQNTALIVANPSCAIAGNAAYICVQRTLGGSDWFLPSVEEVRLLYLQKTMIETKTGILLSGTYWTSGENGINAYRIFTDGTLQGRRKDYSGNVRAMRYF